MSHLRQSLLMLLLSLSELINHLLLVACLLVFSAAAMMVCACTKLRQGASECVW